MTCQELLALSGALSAALPTGQLALDSFLTSLTKGISDRRVALEERAQWTNEADNCSCCYEPANEQWPEDTEKVQTSKSRRFFRVTGNCCVGVTHCMRKYIKKLVEYKYFQQGILLAILINTLSMGIEYHNQVRRLIDYF